MTPRPKQPTADVTEDRSLRWPDGIGRTPIQSRKNGGKISLKQL